MKTPSLAFFRSLATAACLLASGCLLTTNFDKDQCVVTTDCTAKGPAFANTECSLGVCVATATSGVGAGACKSNAECLARPDTPNTYCSSAGTCEPILNEDCTQIVTYNNGPIDPSAVIIGEMQPLTGVDAVTGAARVKASILAFNEFSQFGVGIPSGPGTKPRPLAMVVCNQAVDADRAATHLAVDVKVPVVLGPAMSGVVVKVAKDVLIPNGVAGISPTAVTPDIGLLQDNDLIWRTATPFTPEGTAFANILSQMEVDPTVRANLELAQGAPIRVAILAKGDSYGKGLANLLLGLLHFNGTDVTGNGSNFHRFDFPDLQTNPNADTTSIVAELVQYKPHVILVIGTAEMTTYGANIIEETWITGATGSPRPYYVFSEGSKLSTLRDLIANSEVNHSDRRLKNRVQVWGPRYNATLLNTMAARYQAAFGETMPDVYGVTGNYDGFYLIAYALTAMQTQPFTGTTVAAGLKMMVAPGVKISAGPDDVSRALIELGSGRNIDYDGVTGPLDFDITTGDSIGDYNLYCGGPAGYTLQEQWFDSTHLILNGAYVPCP